MFRFTTPAGLFVGSLRHTARLLAMAAAVVALAGGLAYAPNPFRWW
jgi:hypothetical protein